MRFKGYNKGIGGFYPSDVMVEGQDFMFLKSGKIVFTYPHPIELSKHILLTLVLTCWLKY